MTGDRGYAGPGAAQAARMPNHATLTEVRSDALDWLWREVSFMRPHIDPTDAEIAEVVGAALPPTTTDRLDAVDRWSVLEVQQWAAYIAGMRAGEVEA